jgi:hydroxymethylbilane synthase
MSAAMPLRVGTRGSPLALIQARTLIDLLRDRHAGPVQEHVIRTTGDAVQDRRLSEIGGKGLFAREIHDALRQHRIDCAVHSLKDLETSLPPGIVLGCTLAREDARDALILADAGAAIDSADPFDRLRAGAVVGTSSVRRQAQLLHARPDVAITALRGNVQTRLTKLTNGACDASLLALAGLKRLGLADRANAVLDPDIMVPAAGQGIIGVTVRQDDGPLRELLAAIEDHAARSAATAERAMLLRLDGSCRTPIAAFAEPMSGDRLHLTGLVARADGSFLLRRTLEGAAAEAEKIGRELGDSLRTDSPHDIFD